VNRATDASGNFDLAEKTDIHNGVSVGAYRNGSIIGTGNLFSGGIYTIPNIPINKYSDYPVVVKFEDSTNVFSDDEIDVIVPSSADSETSTGKTQLVTKSGTVCASNDSACIANQVAMTGDINVNVSNSLTGAPIPGVDVDLIQGQSLNGPTISTKATNLDGVATFTGIEYGKYAALINDSSYDAGESVSVLQEPSLERYISLSPSDSEYDASFSSSVGDSEADMDFKLYARNPAGYECEVSPVNKYCAYAEHSNDANPSAPGTERINIKDFAVAKYKTTIEPAADYGGSCT